MKVKNRRSATRTGSDQDQNSAGQYDYHSPKRRRNVEANPRSAKIRKSPNQTVPNGNSDARVEKKRKNPNPLEHSASASQPLSPKTAQSNLSNSCSSSASSVASSSGDPTDPYEFAVKADDEPSDYQPSSVHMTTSASAPPPPPPPMKMMKLDRMEDRCLPDSARSSPLAHSQLSQLSPDSRSSPLAIHCTRPLSVLTDFPTASAASFSREVDLTVSSQPKPPVGATSYAHNLDTVVARPSAGSLCSTRPPSPPTLQHQSLSECSVGKAVTERSTGAIDGTLQRQPCSPRGTNRPCPVLDSPTSPLPSTLAATSQIVVMGNANVSPTAKRCVGVNTTLDTSKSTVTEPDLLGPCEPGTTICLNGIVWLETTTGVLVVNVTWRGRTYIGTLLDATQHDFAPPCPRDYVPAFKSSAVRSSNRNKRRTGLANNYRHHSSAGSAGSSEANGKSIPTMAAQRNRLRGRTGNSPMAATTTSQGARTTDATEADIARDGAKNRSETSGRDTEPVNALASDEEAVLDAKATNSKHGSCSSSSECPSDCLHDGDKNDGSTSLENPRPCTVPSTQTDDSCATANTDGSKVIERVNGVDDELRNTFPIICPIEGCQKRFTNMTALRFHLNHTRHESSPTVNSQARAIPASGNCTPSAQQFKANTGSAESSPPTNIFPSCSSAISISSSRPRSAECTDRNKIDGFPLIPANKDIVDVDRRVQPSCGSAVNNPTGYLPSSMAFTSTIESQRPCSKGLSSTLVNQGVANDPLAGTQLSARTVTAHTVSIPCGLTGLSDGSGESNGPRTSHSSATRQRCSSGVRSDTHNRSRGHSTTKSSNHTHKTESRRNTDLTMDYFNSTPFLARSALGTTPTFASSRTETGPADFVNLPSISQGALGLPVPSTNQLFPLVWNFPNSTGADNAIHPDATPYADGSVPSIPSGTHATSMFASPLARPSVCGLPQPTISLPTGQVSTSSSGYNPIAEPSHSSMSSSQATNRSVSQNLIDPASFYGLPEFLVVAAMNALNANGADNAAQSPYALPPGIPGLPRPVQFSPADLASTHPTKPPNQNIVNPIPPPMPSLASVFPGTMVHNTSLAPGGLPSVAPTSVPGVIPPVSSERFDPFKLSAAYLMQQAVAGSQLSSIFGQP